MHVVAAIAVAPIVGGVVRVVPSTAVPIISVSALVAITAAAVVVSPVLLVLMLTGIASRLQWPIEDSA